MSELRRRFPEASFEYLLNTGWTFERQRDADAILASARICATGEELRPFPSPRSLPECEAERAKEAATAKAG